MTRDCIHVMTTQGPKTIPINSKEVYGCAIFRQHGNFWNARIKKTTELLDLKTITLVQKLKALCKDVTLSPTQREVFYNFAFTLYREEVFLMNA